MTPLIPFFITNMQTAQIPLKGQGMPFFLNVLGGLNVVYDVVRLNGREALVMKCEINGTLFPFAYNKRHMLYLSGSGCTIRRVKIPGETGPHPHRLVLVETSPITGITKYILEKKESAFWVSKTVCDGVLPDPKKDLVLSLTECDSQTTWYIYKYGRQFTVVENDNGKETNHWCNIDKCVWNSNTSFRIETKSGHIFSYIAEEPTHYEEYKTVAAKTIKNDVFVV